VYTNYYDFYIYCREFPPQKFVLKTKKCNVKRLNIICIIYLLFIYHIRKNIRLCAFPMSVITLLAKLRFFPSNGSITMFAITSVFWKSTNKSHRNLSVPSIDCFKKMYLFEKKKNNNDNILLNRISIRNSISAEGYFFYNSTLSYEYNATHVYHLFYNILYIHLNKTSVSWGSWKRLTNKTTIREKKTLQYLSVIPKFRDFRNFLNNLKIS